MVDYNTTFLPLPKFAKTKLSCKQLSPQSYRNLNRKIGKLDKKINANVAKFHINMVKQKGGKNGVMDRQNFWKLKRVLAPKSLEIPHAIEGAHGNLITDPININHEYHNEFQHRLRKREIWDHLSWYESFQNNLCMLRIYVSKAKVSPDFTMDEVKTAVDELKTGKCMDPLGLIQEVFKHSSEGFLQSLVDMANNIKRSKVIPLEWNNMCIKVLKKNKGFSKKLNNYHGIFIVLIISVIFEKLLKNRITPTLEQNMSKFQNGGMRGKGVVDNLFLLRGLLDHAKYLGKEVWVTFYDIEKCFDSLWLQDCINSLWENGIKDDILSLEYFLNTKANIVVKSPFGETKPFICSSIIKQGAVLGPVLNNCSLDRIPVESHGYFLGSVEIKLIEFVDDIADPNEGQLSAQMNNKIIDHIQHERRLMFSEEKCELLKVNNKVGDATIQVNEKSVKTVRVVRYLGDHFNCKRNNKDLCKEWVKKATGTIIELMAL